MKPCKKPCPRGTVCNLDTGRCVKRSGARGHEFLTAPRNAEGRRILNVISQEYIKNARNVYESPEGTYSVKSLANLVYHARFAPRDHSGPRLPPRFPLRSGMAMTPEEQTTILHRARALGWTPDGTVAEKVRKEIEERWYAALASSSMAAVRRYIDAGVDVNSGKGLKGHTPLSIAIARGSMPVFTMLIEAGADPNVPVPAGSTHVLQAIHFDRPEMLRELLAAGATIDITALTLAMEKKHVHLVKVFLDAGADTEIRTTEGKTLLMLAVDMEHIPMITMLLAGGAKVDATDARGTTVLMMAVIRKSPEMVDVLLADGHPTIDARDVTGSTALILAAAVNRMSIVNQLLVAGADINARNKAGMTALGIASERRYTPIITFLRASGGLL